MPTPTNQDLHSQFIAEYLQEMPVPSEPPEFFEPLIPRDYRARRRAAPPQPMWRGRRVRDLPPVLQSLAQQFLTQAIEEENDQFRRMHDQEQAPIIARFMFEPANVREADVVTHCLDMADGMLNEGFRLEGRRSGEVYLAVREYRRREVRPRPETYRNYSSRPEPTTTHVSFARGQGEIRDSHMALMNQTFGRIPEAIPAPTEPPHVREPRVHYGTGRPSDYDLDTAAGDMYLDGATGRHWLMSPMGRWQQTSAPVQSRSAQEIVRSFRSPPTRPQPTHRFTEEIQNLGRQLRSSGVEGTVTGRVTHVDVIDDVQAADAAPAVAPTSRADHRPAIAAGSFHDVLARRERQANELIAAIGDMERDQAIHTILSFVDISKVDALIVAVKRVNNP